MTPDEHDWNDEIKSLLADGANDVPPSGEVKARLKERIEATLAEPALAPEAPTSTVETTKSLSSLTALGIAAVGVVSMVVLSEPEEETLPITRTPTYEQQLKTKTSYSTQPPEKLAEVRPTKEAVATPVSVTPSDMEKTDPTLEEIVDSLKQNAVEKTPKKEGDVTGTKPVKPTEPKNSVGAPTSDLKAEESILEKARAALKSGTINKARRYLRTHAKRFPRGVLIEEREGLRVRALLKLGRKKQAARRATRFLKRFPRSSQRPMVEEALLD